MAEVIWTEPALEDLDEIAEYIALDKPSAAQKLVKKVFERVDRLGIAPNSGRRVPELYPSNYSPSKYKEVLVGPCRIFYRVSEESVYILHVMRVERELRRFLIEERE
jgi:toxin ParE1/3/4